MRQSSDVHVSLSSFGLKSPYGLALDGQGNLYVANNDNDAGSTISLIVPSPGTGFRWRATDCAGTTSVQFTPNTTITMTVPTITTGTQSLPTSATFSTLSIAPTSAAISIMPLPSTLRAIASTLPSTSQTSSTPLALSSSTTFLIGPVIGGVVVLLAIVGLVTFCIVRRRRRKKALTLVSESGKETHAVQVVGGEYSIMQIVRAPNLTSVLENAYGQSSLVDHIE